MLTSKTERAILEDCRVNGSCILAPRAGPFLSKLASKGLIVYKKLSNGWWKVKVLYPN
jgi:hypothetical protein